MTQPFVHLRVHSEYSLVDGLVRIKPLAKQCSEMAMPALALTDFCNMFALVKFQRATMDAGIKPIYGADVLIESVQPDEPPSQVVLLAKSLQGYRNLTELVSESYLHGQKLDKAIISRDYLSQKTEGLICLSGGKQAEIGRALLSGKQERALELVQEYNRLFPDSFYLELQRTGRQDDETYLHLAVELAYKTDCPVVATNDVRFLKREDFEAHEVRVCIYEGWTLEDPSREQRYSEEQYLKSPEEMWELFQDIPEAIENTLEIARRCSFEIPLGTYYLPDYPVPDGMTLDDFIIAESRKGLEERLAFLFDVNAPDFAEIRKPYDERLQVELDVIIQMGFPGYFLIVADFIQWAKNNGVPVGPGRGSGAGSLVAYVLKITDLDPLEYDLLFERFLNPERVSMPDFDVDFCMDGRDRVIDYVAEKYGRNAVSQIITFGSMAAKAVVRDVGRVQGRSYGFVDRIAKLIPFEVGMTLSKAMEQEPQLQELYDRDEEIRELLDMALKLEGITRNVGKHAGGVVIAPSALTDYVPLYCDEQGNNLVTQFDKDDVEAAGLVKFDFLGLRTLTIVDWALKTINPMLAKQGKPPVDIDRIPLDDQASFDLLQKAETTAVFQLESRGMKDLIKRLKPSTFEDIVALVALFRPGPLGSGMVDDFIARKHGRQKVDYPHPDLKPVLDTTYGTILYQEQVMLIPQVLADFTLGGADLLRRAMGKKKADVMAQQRGLFVDGAAKNGIDPKLSGEIFDTMEEFAKYGFNKSHSAAYALVSYQTAWLKAHYPAGFMAAVLSADMHNTDKVVTLIDECRRMKLAIVSPDVNVSEYKFTVDEQQQIVYGLGAIKGLGEGPIEAILEGREDGKPFKNLFEFCRRLDMKKLNRRSMEALIRAGALDKLGPDRATLMASLEEAMRYAEQESKNQDLGIMDMFGAVEEEERPEPEWARVKPWSDDERLNGEKDTLGLYLTGHPIDQYLEEISHFVTSRIADVKPGSSRESRTIVAGLVIAQRVMKNKRGDKMAFLTLDDKSGRLEISIFSDTYEEYKDQLVKDAVLVVEGEVSIDDYSGGLKMVTRKVFGIAQARENYARLISLDIGQTALGPDFSQKLQSALAPYREGGCKVRVQYSRPGAKGRLYLGDEWRISPKAELIKQLEQLCGERALTVLYR
ncbi:DNA polymerase III subunit alpha [Ketobacter sp.]|uniref:DNA polymerase III subunit alpha n=1 Tax=Ketobacter sp. TaxID=2083498 RepID=UPI000F2AC0B4|nr:DNA polymerase III subunit alpha [Ketobacter sp.]RLT92653.1 MAG: DNA polymerase III subunit alpha [Ketobacter sp.]